MVVKNPVRIGPITQTPPLRSVVDFVVQQMHNRDVVHLFSVQQNPQQIWA